MNDPTQTSRETLAASTVAAISDLPGVARLVPSFREALTVTTKHFFGAEDSEATVVDIVEQEGRIEVYIDLYTDGSRPAGEIVDDIHQRVNGLLTPDEQEKTAVKVRVLGIDRTRNL